MIKLEIARQLGYQPVHDRNGRRISPGDKVHITNSVTRLSKRDSAVIKEVSTTLREKSNYDWDRYATVISFGRVLQDGRNVDRVNV